MPLLQGKTGAAISENISRLMSEGYPHKQAVAIALKESRKKRRPQKIARGRVWRGKSLVTGEKLWHAKHPGGQGGSQGWRFKTKREARAYVANAGHPIAGVIMGAVAGVLAGGVVAGYYIYRDVGTLSAADRQALLDYLAAHPAQAAADIAAIQDPKLKTEVQTVVADEKVAGYLWLGTVGLMGLLGYMIAK